MQLKRATPSAEIELPANQLKDPISILSHTYSRLKQAEQLRQKKQLQQAELICLSLLKQFPGYFGALHTLGLIYADLGNRYQAAAYLTQAAIENPESWETLTALAGECILTGSKESAERALRDALAINPVESSIYATLAKLQSDQRRYLEAYHTAKRAMELDSGFPTNVHLFARASIELGRYGEAFDALNELRQSGKATLDTLIVLAGLPKSYLQPNLLDEIENPRFNTKDDTTQQTSAREAVRSVVYDKLDQHKNAWECSVRSNAYALKEMRTALLDEIKTVESRLDWLKRNFHKLPDNDISEDRDYPQTLFIFGVSRSGKTTAESLISSQPVIKRGYENDAVQRAIKFGYQSGGFVNFKSAAFLPTQLYPTVSLKYRENLDVGNRKDVIFTNTSPGLVWDAPFLYKSIPNIKFVFVKRNKHDLMLRIFMKKYKTGGNNYAYELSAIRKYIEMYDEIVEVLRNAYPDHTMILQYEDMVSDPSNALGRMCEFCGFKMQAGQLPDIPSDVGCSQPYRELIDAALANPDALFRSP